MQKRRFAYGIAILSLLIVGALAYKHFDLQRRTSAQALYHEWTEARTPEESLTDGSNVFYVRLIKEPYADVMFLEGIHHRKQPVRWLSKDALAALRTTRSFIGLVNQLKAPDQFRREAALDTIARFEAERAAPVIVSVLQHDPAPQNRWEAAGYLARFPSPNVESALLAALQDEPTVAAFAAEALGKIQSVKAIPLTVALLPRLSDPQLFEMAVNGLSNNNHKQAIRPLIDVLALLDQRFDPGWDEIRGRVLRKLGACAERVRLSPGQFPANHSEWIAWWEHTESTYPEVTK